MPLPRFKKLDSDRQNAILTAAKAEFIARGFSAASYNTIIKEAGLSKGAMYYYFADKADLCHTVLEPIFRQLAEATGEIGEFEDAQGFWARVAALLERAMGLMLETPEVAELGRLIYDEGSNSEVLSPLVERAEAWCTQLLRAGQRVNAVRSDIPLAFLAAAVTGLLVHTDRWLARRYETLDPAQIGELGFVCLQMVEQIAAPPISTLPASPTSTHHV